MLSFRGALFAEEYLCLADLRRREILRFLESGGLHRSLKAGPRFARNDKAVDFLRSHFSLSGFDALALHSARCAKV
jgi:hypothetical protein